MVSVSSRSRYGLIDRIDRGLDEFWALTPGIRGAAGEGQVALFVVLYAPLAAVFLLLLLVMPAVALIGALVFAVVTDGWQTRHSLASWLPPLRSTSRRLRTLAWIALVAALLLIGLPTSLLACLFFIAAPLIGLAWWIVWRERGPIHSRVVHAAVAVVATPVALTVWYLRRGAGWGKLAVLAGIILSLQTYALPFVLSSGWSADSLKQQFGSVLLALAVACVSAIALFVVSAAIRVADHYCELEEHPHRSSAMASGRQIHAGANGLWGWIPSAGSSLVLRLGLWAAVQSLFVAPWVVVVQTFDPVDRVFIYIFVGIAALPMAATSLIAVLQGWKGGHRTVVEWLTQHLGRAMGSSLLLALGMGVTFVTLSSRSLLHATTGLPFTIVVAVVAGLNIGLSLRMGRGDRLRRYVTYPTTALVAVLVLSAALLFMFAGYLPPTDPDNSSEFMTDLSQSADYPAAAALGLCLGLLISAVLHPGLKAFAAAMASFREMVKPLVGFVCGYVLIVLTFGAVYYAIYQTSGGFECATADPVSNSTTVVDCSRLTSNPVAETDFMFFSVNTALPLGYSRIRPAEDAHRVQWLAAAELILGTAWVVIVFAAMLHAIQHKMIRDSVAQLRQRQPDGLWSVGPMPPAQLDPSSTLYAHERSN